MSLYHLYHILKGFTPAYIVYKGEIKKDYNITKNTQWMSSQYDINKSSYPKEWSHHTISFGLSNSVKEFTKVLLKLPQRN